jgi:hypothetical protein
MTILRLPSEKKQSFLCNWLEYVVGTVLKGIVRLGDGLEFCSSLRSLMILILCPER